MVTTTISRGVARETTLSLGEWAVTDEPNAMLTCLGLGSCVALIAYDAVKHVGGVAHMVLPDSTQGRATTPNSAKFVDQAVPMMVRELTARGALRSRLEVHLVGGAQMLAAGRGLNDRLNIGDRNIEATRAACAAAGLRVVREELGGQRGRTVRLHVDTGDVEITTSGGHAAGG